MAKYQQYEVVMYREVVGDGLLMQRERLKLGDIVQLLTRARET